MLLPLELGARKSPHCSREGGQELSRGDERDPALKHANGVKARLGTNPLRGRAGVQVARRFKTESTLFRKINENRET